MLNEEQMIAELEELLTSIDQQMKVVSEQAEEMGVSVYELKNIDGSHPMGDLLVAKAQALKAVLDYKMATDDTVLHTEYGVLVTNPASWTPERIIPCDRNLKAARANAERINWDSTDASAQIVYRQCGEWTPSSPEALTPDDKEDPYEDLVEVVTLTRENIPELAAKFGKDEKELWHLYNTALTQNKVVYMLKDDLSAIFKKRR